MKTNKKIIESPFDSYFGVFLNMGCSLRCEYCVQRISLPHQPVVSYPIVPGREWVLALNSITGRTKRRNLLITKKKKLAITGGEPTIHPDFPYILNNLDRNWKITVTTNFSSPFFEGKAAGLRQIKPRKELKFSGSYHFLYAPFDKFVENVLKVKKAGLIVHILFVVGVPGRMKEAEHYKNELLKIHPEVKIQRFLGYHDNALYPLPADKYDIEYDQQDGIFNYVEYERGFGQRGRSSIYCHMNKVLFAPNGDIYNCHYKLYTGHKDKLGNLFDEARISVPQGYFLCGDYGFCNPCDAEGHLFKTIEGKEFNMSAR
jgi:MoaA/NifB/PqqE/SkfB family radical SAM enzyme